MREIPEIKYDKSIERLMKHYRRSYADITKELIRLLETDSFHVLVSQEASLLRQLGLILEENDKNILPEVEELLKKSFKEGQARTLMSIGEATTLAQAAQGVSFSMMATKTAEAMVSDTFEDVLAITDRTNKKIKKTVRDIAGEVMRMNSIQGIGYNTSRQEIMTGLLKKGFSKKITKDFKGVTDSAGRKWQLDKYVNMLVKTKIQQAYIQGVQTEAVERGVDMALISSHGAKDACGQFEGMVISLTGATKGLPTLAELKRSNKIFHPHCKHTVTPLRSLDLLPESVREKHEKKLKAYNSSK